MMKIMKFQNKEILSLKYQILRMISAIISCLKINQKPSNF